MRKALNNIISIVTPSFNQGNFLEQTIKSVISQEGDFYIDYIIADGGSTDHSIEIIKKYDALIKSNTFVCRCRGVELSWWSQKDSGQSAALNKGFRQAKGDIFAWINSDDYYDDFSVFQTIKEAFAAHRDVDLVCGSGRIIDVHNREKSIHKVMYVDGNTLLKRGCDIFQPSAFFTRKIFYEAGAIDEQLHYAMDFDLWIRMTQKAKGLIIDTLLSNFREWEHSKSLTSDKEFIKEEKYISKKYGGNMISFRFIRKMRQNVTFFDWLKKTYPSFYTKGRSIFYSLVDHFQY